MSAYKPGPAHGAHVDKDGERWTLVLTRDLKHAPEAVWEAITEPAELAQWAPFEAERSLATTGALKLTTVGGPSGQCTVKRADAPRVLEYTWGDQDLRWELEPNGEGTRLTLWHNITRNFIAWGAAGWHICLDVLDSVLAGAPIGRIVGPDAMKFDWPRLNREYAKAFGVDVVEFKGAE